MNRRLNIYDKIVILIISSLVFGAIGGSLQVIRFISIILLPFNIYHLVSKRISKNVLMYLLFGVFWIIYAIFSLSWCKDITMAKINVFYLFIHFNIAYSIVRLGMHSVNPIKTIIIGWLCFLLLTFPLALSEIITNRHFYTNSLQMEAAEIIGKLNGIENKRYAAATYGNYNEYMTALSFALPYLLGALLIYKETKQQLCLWMLVFIDFIIIVISASRGAILTFGLCIGLFVYYYKNLKFQAKKLIITLISIVGILGIALCGTLLFRELTMRIEGSNAKIAEDVGRIEMYITEWEMLQESHYLGIGTDGFNSAGFAPHNLWLEILVQYGIYVFIFFVYILLTTLYKSILKNKHNLYVRAIGLMVFSSLPIISVINSAYLNYPFFWVAAGSMVLLLESISMQANKISNV